jgi:hypothetical protein
VTKDLRNCHAKLERTALAHKDECQDLRERERMRLAKQTGKASEIFTGGP